MKTVTLGVSSLDETMDRAAAALRCERQGARISFTSVELNAGILDRTEDGRVILPYGAVRVDFTVSKATDPRHSANRKARVGRRSA